MCLAALLRLRRYFPCVAAEGWQSSSPGLQTEGGAEHQQMAQQNCWLPGPKSGRQPERARSTRCGAISLPQATVSVLLERSSCRNAARAPDRCLASDSRLASDYAFRFIRKGAMAIHEALHTSVLVMPFPVLPRLPGNGETTISIHFCTLRCISEKQDGRSCAEVV